MKRLVGGLVAAALMAMTATTASAATSARAQSDLCTRSDMQLFANAGFEVARLHCNHPTGSEKLHDRADHIWNDCQFRFYDDNDVEGSEDNPEIPHVFSEDDYFLAGVFNFWFQFELSADFNRNDAITAMKADEDRFFWGPSTAANHELAEIPVTYGPYRNGVLPFGLAVGNHRYVIFSPGSQPPGEYKWRRVFSYFGSGPFETHGTVIITPGS